MAKMKPKQKGAGEGCLLNIVKRESERMLSMNAQFIRNMISELQMKGKIKTQVSLSLWCH